MNVRVAGGDGGRDSVADLTRRRLPGARGKEVSERAGVTNKGTAYPKPTAGMRRPLAPIAKVRPSDMVVYGVCW